MSARPLVYVAGYLSIDTISTAGQTRTEVPGGAALYAALGALAAGARVSIMACAGEDYPDAWLIQLAALGIDISHIRRKSGPTRRAQLANMAGGNRVSAHHDQAGWWERTLTLAPEPMADIEADCLMLAPMAPELAVRMAKAARCPVIADTSAAFARLDPKTLLSLAAAVSCFAPSIEETRILLPGIPDSDAVRQLASAGANVVQKRGADGLFICAARSRRVRLVRAPATTEVDPTGAGDATVGALAAGLGSGQTLHEAALRATRIGALTVSGHGPSALGFDWQHDFGRLAS